MSRPAWRPIDYYDGTFQVLLYDKHAGVIVGGRDAHGWYVCGPGTEYHDSELRPTHWADLPEPPQ